MGNKLSENVRFKSSIEAGIEKSAAIFELLGWKYTIDSPKSLSARTGMNAFGWGEIIKVSFGNDKTMTVESESRNPFQLVDLGKNQNNVDKFLEIFKNAKLPLQQSVFGHEKNRSFLDRFFSGR